MESKAPDGNTEMFLELEQSENVARGHVEVIEMIAYDATKEPQRNAPEKPGLKGQIKKDKDGNTMYVETSRGPFFCQTPEQEGIFRERNKGSRIEMFTIQMRKSTAISKINTPENVKEFKDGK